MGLVEGWWEKDKKLYNKLNFLQVIEREIIAAILAWAKAVF